MAWQLMTKKTFQLWLLVSIITIRTDAILLVNSRQSWPYLQLYVQVIWILKHSPLGWARVWIIWFWTSKGIHTCKWAVLLYLSISKCTAPYSRGRPLKGVKIDVPQGYTGNKWGKALSILSHEWCLKMRVMWASGLSYSFYTSIAKLCETGNLLLIVQSKERCVNKLHSFGQGQQLSSVSLVDI